MNTETCLRRNEASLCTMSKDINYRRMINSTRWLRLRKEKLKESPLCEDCKAEGKYTAACEIHHVRPCEWAKSVKEMERLMFDFNNLKSLCHDCHVVAHKNLGSHTKEQMAENVQKKVKRFISRYFD